MGHQSQHWGEMLNLAGAQLRSWRRDPVFEFARRLSPSSKMHSTGKALYIQPLGKTSYPSLGPSVQRAVSRGKVEVKSREASASLRKHPWPSVEGPL